MNCLPPLGPLVEAMTAVADQAFQMMASMGRNELKAV